MAIWVLHMEVPFSPFCVSWPFGLEPFSLQVSPEFVYILPMMRTTATKAKNKSVSVNAELKQLLLWSLSAVTDSTGLASLGAPSYSAPPPRSTRAATLFLSLLQKYLFLGHSKRQSAGDAEERREL